MQKPRQDNEDQWSNEQPSDELGDEDRDTKASPRLQNYRDESAAKAKSGKKSSESHAPSK